MSNASDPSESSNQPDFTVQFDELAAWAELSKLARKIETLTDVDLKSALKEALQVKAEKFREKLTAIPPTAAAIPSLRELFPTLPAGDPSRASAHASARPLSPPTADQLSQVEDLLRKAHLAMIRNNRTEARKYLEEAEKIAPASASVLEALGDEYAAANKMKDAAELYARAKEAAPGNVAIEKKHANAIFRSQAAAAGLSLAAEFEQREVVAGPKAAFLFSLFFPGLGQIVNGQTTKGVVFMVGWLAGWITVYVLGFDNLLGYIGMKAIAKPNIFVVVAAGVAVLCHLAAIFDSLMGASGAPRKVPKPIRPTPPSDLPFE